MYAELLKDPLLWAHLPLVANANLAHGTAGANCSLVGSPTFGGTNPWGLPCLRLNGSTQYVDMANLSTPMGDNCTVCCWIKIDADPPGSSTPTGFMQIGDGFSVAGASHYPFTDGIIYSGIFRWTDAVTLARVTVGNPTPALTAWRFVCITNTPGAGGYKFKIDGAQINGTTTGTTGVYTNSDWTLGRSIGNGTPYYLDGDVSDLWIFKRVLSDLEQSAIMNRVGVQRLSRPLGNGMLHGLPMNNTAIVR